MRVAEKQRKKRAEIAKWSLEDLEADPTQTGFDGSPTQVIEVWPPERKSGGKMLEGSAEEIVEEIADVIKGMHLAAG